MNDIIGIIIIVSIIMFFVCIFQHIITNSRIDDVKNEILSKLRDMEYKRKLEIQEQQVKSWEEQAKTHNLQQKQNYEIQSELQKIYHEIKNSKIRM